MTATTTIAAVDGAGPDVPKLADTAISSPQATQTIAGLAFQLKGWIAPEREFADHLEVRCDSDLLWTLPLVAAEPPKRLLRRSSAPLKQEFEGWLGAFSLPATFEVAVDAVFRSGARAQVARINGSRSSLAPENPDQWFSPVIVSTPSGRTGTTWLVHLLGSHPELVAYSRLGLEPRPALYWLEIAAMLAEPAGLVRMLRPRMSEERWWLGNGPPQVPSPLAQDDPMFRIVLGTSVHELAGMARERTQAFYSSLAAEMGKRPRGFIEKSPYGSRRMDLLAEVYPGLREILLVRDPRDTLCSILAFKRKWPHAVLVSDAPDSTKEFMTQMERNFAGMLGRIEDPSGRTILVRYEDVVLDTPRTLERIFGHVGVNAEASTVEATITAASAGDPFERHRTAASIAESIGRWRRDLDPPTQALAEEIFAPILARMGYT